MRLTSSRITRVDRSGLVFAGILHIGKSMRRVLQLFSLIGSLPNDRAIRAQVLLDRVWARLDSAPQV
eukprot:6153623-Amphidinium_carterae.3